MSVLINKNCPKGRKISVWLENAEKCQEKTCHVKGCVHHVENFKKGEK